VEALIDELEKGQAKIDSATNALQQAREAAHALTDTINVKIKQIDSFAEGIHALEPSKLNEYGIETRKGKSVKAVPAKAMINGITDEPDGVGFIINFLKIAEADHYEIEKGVALNADDKVLSPPYPFLKSTTKTTIYDDDVAKGKRYFYRVRGINASGAGGWSEPVSRVQ